LFPDDRAVSYYGKSAAEYSQQQRKQVENELERARQELAQLEAKRPAPAEGTEALASERQRLRQELEQARQQKTALAKSAQKGGVRGGGSNTLLLELSYPTSGVEMTLQAPAAWTYTAPSQAAPRKVSDSRRTAFENGGLANILIPNAAPGEYRIYGEAVGPVQETRFEGPSVGGTVASVGGRVSLPRKPFAAAPGRRLYFSLVLSADGRISVN